MLALEEVRHREVGANEGGIALSACMALLVLHEQRHFVLSATLNHLERSLLMATCPECGGAIPTASVERGEILPCPDCGAELEVRNLEPLVLELAPEVQEDWGE